MNVAMAIMEGAAIALFVATVLLWTVIFIT
jgi:hypothetical protein